MAEVILDYILVSKPDQAIGTAAFPSQSHSAAGNPLR